MQVLISSIYLSLTIDPIWQFLILRLVVGSLARSGCFPILSRVRIAFRREVRHQGDRDFDAMLHGGS